MAEQLKFTIISPESVKLYGEAEGLSNVPDEIAKSLAEDVTYRLRETIQHASQFMKHSKRRRLTMEDINRALNWSGTEPIYGHGSIESTSFRCTTVKETDIFSVEDKEVGLRELALGNAVPTNPGLVTVKAYWLCIEGVQPGTSSLGMQPGGKSVTGNASEGPQQSLSEASLTYYERVTKTIMGNEEQSRKVALNDLRTNPKMASLLAHFVNFIASGVKIYSHNLLQLSRLLSMVTSLVDNPSLFLEPYVIQLVTSVMYCLLESLAASLNPANDHWRLRDDAASILAHISRKCSNPVNYLKQQLLMTLQEVLLDDGRPYCSHYGAVMGLTELGPEALEQYLFPHLKTYWNQLCQVLDDSSQSNTMLQEEASQVYGALLEAAGHLLRSKQQGVPLNTVSFQVNNSSHPVHNLSPWAAGASMVSRPAPIPARRLRSSSSSASNPNQLYQQLYEVFGDSLTPRVAFNNWQDPAVTRTNLMRIQPIAHAYFPLRPLQRNSSSIRELIQKASEQMKDESVKGDQAVMRKRPKISQSSPPSSYVASEQSELKTVRFLLRSTNKKLNPIRNDYWETDISRDKIKGRKLECDKSSDRPLKRKYPNSGSSLISSDHRRLEVGNIRRRFRRTRPVITNGTKYDFHLGVIL